MDWCIPIIIIDWFYNLVGVLHHDSVSWEFLQNVEWPGGNFGVSDKNLLD